MQHVAQIRTISFRSFSLTLVGFLALGFAVSSSVAVFSGASGTKTGASFIALLSASTSPSLLSSSAYEKRLCAEERSEALFDFAKFRLKRTYVRVCF